MEVFPAEAPYLFDAAGKSQWASASAELLASFAALWAFGHLEPGPRVRKIPVAVSGITDNRSNQSLAVKQSSTKWPLMIINMQVSHHLMRAALRLSLTWRPREENTLADDLTNGRFDSFLADHRMHFLFKDMPLGLLDKLWATKGQFDRLRKELQKSDSASVLPAKRKHDKTSW